MDNNSDLKKIYAGSNPAPPINTNDLIKKATGIKNKKLLSMILTNVALVATGIYISLICINDQSQLITTNIGIIIIIVAILIYIIVSNKLLPILYRINNTQNTKQYLKDLHTIKNKQHFLQSNIMNIAFAMLSLGICLSLIESAAQMSTAWAVCAYGITLAWIAFNWFYIRPTTIKKQQKELEELIVKIESVNDQLTEA